MFPHVWKKIQFQRKTLQVGNGNFKNALLQYTADICLQSPLQHYNPFTSLLISKEHTLQGGTFLSCAYRFFFVLDKYTTRLPVFLEKMTLLFLFLVEATKDDLLYEELPNLAWLNSKPAAHLFWRKESYNH